MAHWQAEGVDLAQAEERMRSRHPMERSQAEPPAFRGGCGADSAVGKDLGAKPQSPSQGRKKKKKNKP